MDNSKVLIQVKVKAVEDVCMSRAYDPAGNWREVKQKWLVGAISGVIKTLEFIV